MANKTLFQTLAGLFTSRPDTTNEAGAPAYALSSEQALAQYAVTGCLNGTFYASAQDQLDKVLALAGACDAEFVAKAAVYARRQGLMKDMPALLCAVLAVRDGALLQRVFPQVIDSGKMLRNFVQIVRSGAVGRKSLGTLPRRLVREWLQGRSLDQLFYASLGNSPSLRDVVRMVHPKPDGPARANFYAWLLGKPFDLELLPEAARQLEQYRRGEAELPDVDFRFVSALPLTNDDWRTLAVRCNWTTLRMNLNTFVRHGVFDCFETSLRLAARLADPALIAKAKVFPYQIMTTMQNLDPKAPRVLCDALDQAMEIATQNVPALPGRTVLAIDVSGSMHSAVTGHRKGSTSKTTCLDAAATLAASVLRRNPDATVIPFHDHTLDVRLDAREPITRIAERLRKLPSGGTNCSSVLARLNRERANADTVIYFSDNESWVDARPAARSTAMLTEWRRFKQRNQKAQLVCIDVQPYGTVQAPVGDDVTHVGGFSDQVFEVLREVADGDRSQDRFASRIREVAI
ncbi:MAG: RNA-binding protein [Planctomycetes bacterium]|nr:RNA-binding protein [Planctomycetota bacterium]